MKLYNSPDGGLWYRDDILTGIYPGKSLSSCKMIVAPNPANTELVITYPCTHNPTAVLTRYNSCGIRVSGETVMDLTPGGLRSKADVRRLSPGVYLIHIKTEDIVMPVKELLANMKRTGESSQTHYTIVRTNDEIGELAEGYNEMSLRIHNYISNISRMNEAYYRFVPRQFLDMLGKKDITDITLGDQVEQEMSVMFTDIRDFTSISESMTLRENFDFINSYLGLMEPIISRHHGFIDKYMGDSIMALFDGKVENAIEAAIEMAQTMKDFNQVRQEEGQPAIRMGIGIHTGNLMLGVVGGFGKMEGTVISDAVNLASRLEGLTKIYGSSIIISQETLIRADDPMTYSHRYLDSVKVKGKKEAVFIFELLDGEPEPARSRKTAKRRQFAQAVRLYSSRQFEGALRLFTELHHFDPDDPTLRLYIGRCAERLETGIADDWDGIEVIQTK